MHYEQIIVLGDVQIRGSVLLGGGAMWHALNFNLFFRRLMYAES